MLRRLALAWVIVGCLGPIASAQLRPGSCASCGQAACATHVGGSSGGDIGSGAGINWGSPRLKNLGGGPMDLLPTRTALGRLGLERAWFTYIPLGPTESVLLISHDEDLIFAQTDRANLFAIDAESGQLLWSSNLGPSNAQAKPVSVNKTSVFATNANRLFQLDRGTGRVVRQIPLEAFATTPTAANDDYVVVGLETGQLYGFTMSLRTGGSSAPKSVGSLAFTWKSANRLTSRPIITPSVTAFGSQDRRVFVTTNRPPNVLYRFLTGGPITAGIAPFGTRTVLVPSTDNVLYAVDLFDPEDPRQIHWEFPTGAPIEQEPLVAGEDVYVMNAAGVLFAIDGKTGAAKWSRATNGGRFLSLSPRRVYLQSPEGDLAIVDRATGDILASPRATRERAGLGLRQYNLHVTNADNDRVYLGSKAGQVVALREVGLTLPQILRAGQEPFGVAPTGPDPTAPPAEGDADAADAGADAPGMGNP